MAYTLKEQIAEWRAKAEANAHRRIGEENIREAENLRRLRLQRLELEAKAQREILRRVEVSKIAESRKIIDLEKKEKRAATLRKVGSAVGFVKRAFNPPRNPRSPESEGRKFSVFNPPNVFSGRRIR